MLFFRVIIYGSLLWFLAWQLQISQAGIKPIKHFAEVSAKSKKEFSQLFKPDDSELSQLRAVVASDTTSLLAWQNLTAALEKFYFDFGLKAEATPNSLVIEYIHGLSEIIKLSPDDTDTLLKLAQISFENKVFDKSVLLYERYLTKFPDDANVRSKYASALAFIGESLKAEKELELVLANDPEHFQANAFMAILAAQNSELQKAQLYGERALNLAPSAEARARLNRFLEKTKVKTTDKGLSALESYLKTNPITKNKLVKLTHKEDVVTIVFQDFPIDAMPSFAKEKFFTRVEDALEHTKWKRVDFVDHVTNQLLGSLVNSNSE